MTMYCNSGEFCSFSLSNERNGRLSKSASVASFNSAFSSSSDLLGLCGQKMKDSFFIIWIRRTSQSAITFDHCRCRLSTRFDCSLWSMHLPKNGRVHFFHRRCCCAIDSVFPSNEKNELVNSEYIHFTNGVKILLYLYRLESHQRIHHLKITTLSRCTRKWWWIWASLDGRWWNWPTKIERQFTFFNIEVSPEKTRINFGMIVSVERHALLYRFSDLV